MGQVWVLCLALNVALTPEEWCVEMLQGGQEMLAIDGVVVPSNENSPGVSQSEGLGQINNHNQHNKGLRKGEWWCASTVPEEKSLMGKGMLLHQRDDADADRGHS